MSKTRKKVERKQNVSKVKSASPVDGIAQEEGTSHRTLSRSTLRRQQLRSLRTQRKLGRRCRKKGVTLQSTILNRLSQNRLKNGGEVQSLNVTQTDDSMGKETKRKCIIVDLTQTCSQEPHLTDHKIDEDKLSKLRRRQGLSKAAKFTESKIVKQSVNGLPSNSMAKCSDNNVSFSDLNASLSDSFAVDSSSDELESCAAPQNAATESETPFHALSLVEVEPMYLCRHYGDRTVILMKSQCRVSMRGKAIVKCIYGKASVHGFEMLPNGQEYSVYCPNSSSYLALESHSSQDVVCCSKSSDFCELESELKSFLNDYPTVVILRPLHCPVMTFITGQAKFHGLFHDLIVLGGGSSTDTITIQDAVVDAANSWLADAKNGVNAALAVCGGLNTGKSTTCRFIVNHALNYVSQVAYLECDLGQTEFTLPGCVSLTLIDKPLLGTPFTHQKTPLSCVFVGRLSPASCAGFYVQCMKRVYSAYLSMPSRPPLIINTMGWMKDVGLALLIDTLRLTRPAYIIQLSNNKLHQMRHLPKMTPDFLATSKGVVFKQADDSPLTYKWIEIASEVKSRIQGDNTYNAPCRRELAILAYFGHLWSNSSCSMSLRAVTPYQVCWSDVAIHVCHEVVPNSHVLYAVNGSIVALCFADQSQIVDSGVERCPKFIRRNSVCECLGFGIVRSVSEVERALYIITPLSQSSLQKVNCLQLGAICLPIYALKTDEALGPRYTLYQPDNIEIRQQNPSCFVSVDLPVKEKYKKALSHPIM